MLTSPGKTQVEWKISTDETAEKAEDEISALQSQFLEDISVCDEELLEKITWKQKRFQHQISEKCNQRAKTFPQCFFGSALKIDRGRRIPSWAGKIL